MPTKEFLHYTPHNLQTFGISYASSSDLYADPPVHLHKPLDAWHKKPVEV